MASFLSLFTLTVLFSLIHLFPSITLALVPPQNQFKYVNYGKFEHHYSTIEYNANYRETLLAEYPFSLCFYNTTPNAFTLALLMGKDVPDNFRNWVWEANRGNPVQENATLSFGSNGNLVLANPNGRIVWQTNTTNKGVTGLKLLTNGNMVLHDSKGKFIWQSFDYPTDTLLVGQSLRVGGPSNKLVSRVSEKVNSNGPYSLVLEPKGFSMYFTSHNSPKPMIYFNSSDLLSTLDGTFFELNFVSFKPEDEDETGISQLGFKYTMVNPKDEGERYLARLRYNGTMAYLRFGIDGNIRFLTYDMEAGWNAWETPYSLFSRDSKFFGECQLPSRCGMFGLCEENECVACPTTKGLFGWSNKCATDNVISCNSSEFHYYKIEGAEHFMSKYTKGNGQIISVTECETKCTQDCKCKGYFYRQYPSKCLIVYDLMTLTKVSNPSHLAFIKAPNH